MNNTKDFNFTQAVEIEAPEFLRQDWERGGNLSLWVGLYEYNGKKYKITYAFKRDEVVSESGDDILAEYFPWDEEHVYDVENVEEQHAIEEEGKT